MTRERQRRTRERAPRQAATRLTLRVCQAASHSRAAFRGANGKATYRVEVLWDSEIRGFGLRLLPSGKKTWVLRYRHAGRQRLVDLGNWGTFTLDEARQRARRALIQVEDGNDPFLKREATKTLAAIAPDFLAACRQRVDALEIRASTAAKYAENFAALTEVLGDRPLDEIDGRATRRAFAEITKARGRFAANRCLCVLRIVLRLAADAGDRDASARDPTADISLHRESPRGLEFSDVELASLGAALDAEEQRRPAARDTVAAIRLLALTGARRREITSLTWGEVDLPGMRLRLRSSKTGPRSIALNTAAAALLAALRAAAPSTTPEDRIFPPTEHEAGFAIQYTWRRVRKAAHLPPNARLHDLRHHYVTRGLAANFFEVLVGRAVGHASSATTRRYSHVTLEPVRQLVERVGGEIAAALAGHQPADVEQLQLPPKRDDDAGARTGHLADVISFKPPS
jgi:integrase